MCGVFGYVLSKRPVDGRGTLETALRSLHHRGPDDRGTYEGEHQGRVVGFAHTRLSILDLSPSGHQPMVSKDGRYVMVYNGEIYNFADVRADLEACGESFVSSGDSEVLLAAYARWGEACLDRLRGMFAFAIWDTREGTLFLARDRLGVKPLYYVETPDGIAFASEVRALLATGFAARRLSPEGLSSYLLFGSVREPDTILQGVRSLAAGSILVHARGETKVRKYWSLPLREAQFLDRDDAVDQLRELLLDSVRLRLVSDVPVGVFLSSGVDSAAIVALASIVSRTPIHTFTVTWNAGEDEGVAAADVAYRFGCIHTEARLDTHAIGDDMPAALAALDQPSADGVNTFFVSRAARQAGLVVALSGVGGDELFAGYPMFRRFGVARAMASLAWPAAARRAAARIASGARIPSPLRKAVALLDTSGGADEAYAVFRSMFVPSQVERLVGGGAARLTNGHRTGGGAVDAALARGNLDAINAYGVLELSNYLGHTLLRDTDAMSMASSLEVRDPLLDHELVEFAMKTPGAFKAEGKGSKPLLADAVPEVTREIRTRKKRGFVLPFDTWLRGPLRGWMHDRVLGGGARAWVDRGVAEELVRTYDAGGRGVTWSRVWCLAVLADWCARHRVEA